MTKLGYEYLKSEAWSVTYDTMDVNRTIDFEGLKHHEYKTPSVCPLFVWLTDGPYEEQFESVQKQGVKRDQKRGYSGKSPEGTYEVEFIEKEKYNDLQRRNLNDVSSTVNT